MPAAGGRASDGTSLFRRSAVRKQVSRGSKRLDNSESVITIYLLSIPSPIQIWPTREPVRLE
jgi:hypothetical protein